MGQIIVLKAWEAGRGSHLPIWHHALSQPSPTSFLISVIFLGMVCQDKVKYRLEFMSHGLSSLLCEVPKILIGFDFDLVA
jgi:hypothetical protein